MTETITLSNNEKNDYIVFTGCFIGYRERYTVLIECVKSIKNLNLKHYLSLSFDEDSTITETDIKNLLKLNNKLTIYLHPKRLYQFEHILFLNKELDKNKLTDIKIIFMDDDDLLIEMPPHNFIDKFKGKQYSSGIIDDKEYSDFEPYKDGDRIIYDFSGTCVTKKRLDYFFKALFNCETLKEEKQKTFPLYGCDIMLMGSLDIEKEKCDIKPFVYRRFWNIYLDADNSINKKKWHMYRDKSLYDLKNSEFDDYKIFF